MKNRVLIILITVAAFSLGSCEAVKKVTGKDCNCPHFSIQLPSVGL